VFFRAFGPFDLYTDTKPSEKKALAILKQFQKVGLESKGKSWSVFDKYYDDMVHLAKWSCKNFQALSAEFPRTKRDQRLRNCYLRIREFQALRSPSGQRSLKL
jgi:hypothetical protein